MSSLPPRLFWPPPTPSAVREGGGYPLPPLAATVRERGRWGGEGRGVPYQSLRWRLITIIWWG